MAMGADYHRRQFVPKIASGEIAFALGYSEPGAGSDIASARTAATRDGDAWVIEGLKMWATIAHRVQYNFMLTRPSTGDRPQRGLTVFLVPTERTHAFYLSQVWVPDANRVGGVDRGWSVIRFALGLEQAMGYAELQERFIQTPGRWAMERGRGGDRPFDNPRVKEQLARTAIHAEVSRLLRNRSTWLAAEGSFAEAFLETPINTIYGGSAEILRSLVAEVELELPKRR
jgi:alkylation response protein AidB-like acyl-CoA dehydrogenase